MPTSANASLGHRLAISMRMSAFSVVKILGSIIAATQQESCTSE
jgi:hypothetical protein